MSTVPYFTDLTAFRVPTNLVSSQGTDIQTIVKDESFLNTVDKEFHEEINYQYLFFFIQDRRKL